MKAILYLHTDAVRYNNENPDSYINNFRSLVNDLRDIKCFDDTNNQIVVSDDLFVGEIIANSNIFDFINNNLDKDETDFMYSILCNTSNIDSLTYDELKEKTKFRADETECYSTIVLNETETNQPNKPYITFNEYQIVYGRDSWYRLRRQILANHPGNPKSFISNCRKYFPKLTFSKDCEELIGVEHLQGIPRKIVYYLSCINDKLLDFRRGHHSPSAINQLLADFAGEYGMDEAGSLQRTPAKKHLYKFNFLIYGSNSTKSVCCDPHFKIKQYDDNCSTLIKMDGEKCYGRIYFNFGDTDIHPQNILIGSIGPHV